MLKAIVVRHYESRNQHSDLIEHWIHSIWLVLIG